MEAQALWADADRLEVAAAKSGSEPRWAVIGRIEQKTWTAFVTYRHENTIRIISVRRARDNEEAEYRGGRGKP